MEQNVDGGHETGTEEEKQTAKSQVGFMFFRVSHR